MYIATNDDKYIEHVCCLRAAVIHKETDIKLCECSGMEEATKIAEAMNKTFGEENAQTSG